MNRLLRRAAALVLLGASAVAAGSAGPVPGMAGTDRLPFIGADLTPHWLSLSELSAAPRHFPEFELLDQSGKVLQRADLEGQVVVANFFFTGCSTLCPRLRGAMARVHEAYAGAADVRLLSHSVTPELDAPRVLDAYARANGVDGQQWKLLTGERAMIERVAHEGYRVPRAAATDGAVLHTEWLVLLDAQQRVRGIYNGTLPIEVDWLIRDIQLLRRA